jgi:hypothetical protein
MPAVKRALFERNRVSISRPPHSAD